MSNPNHHNPRSAREIITDVVRSDEFLQLKSDDSTREVGAVALLAMSAHAMAEREVEVNRGYETPETLQRRLVGLLPEWLKAQVELDKHRSEMSRAEQRAALEPVIRVNHILREMIDREVYSSVSDVLQFTTEALMGMRYHPRAMQYAKDHLRRILDGMRHEIVSESVLSDIPGVDEVRGGESVDDDMQGKDIYVTYRGQEMALDIKATQRSADKANMTNHRSDYVAVWSGFEWEDFGDRLLPTREVMDRKGDYLATELDRLYNENNLRVAY